jgi:hypothetical protein
VIVWGSRGDVVNFGPQETKDCLTCERPRPFDLIMQYRYGGLYWVFNFVMERKFLLLCQACGRGWELEAKRLNPQLQAKSIPFMRRYGLATLGGIMLLMILTGLGSGTRKHDDQLRDAPASSPAPARAAPQPGVARG